ncbi:MAG: ATP-dependent DNA helicase RecG [Chloroflexi bacterium]|nr:ATP-dependent DNA helicase RecG [Chloroflexota bacterium]
MRPDSPDTGGDTKPRPATSTEPQLLAKVQELLRILSHEKRLGGKDSAVIGGLAGYLSQWRERVAALAVDSSYVDQLLRLVAPLHDYTSLSVEERTSLITAAAAGLTRLIASVSPAVADQPDNKPRSPATLVGRTASSTQDVEAVGFRQNRKGCESVGAASFREGCPPPSPRGRHGGSATTAPTRPEARSGSSFVGDAPAPVASEPPTPPRGASWTASPLDSPVTTVWGVHTATASKLARLGVASVRDLLYFFPRRHNDFSAMKRISELALGTEETVMATIWEVTTKKYGRSGRAGVEVIVGDESGNMRVVFFNQPHMARILRPNTLVVLSGKVEIFKGQKVFLSPQWENLESDDLVHTGRIVPVYPLTEGLYQRSIRKVVKNAVDRWASSLVDHLSPAIRKSAHLIDLPYAITQVHYPDSHEMLAKAKERLAFDELFAIQLGALKVRREWRESQPGFALTVDAGLVDLFTSSLPFALTGAQRRALGEILADQAKTEAMARLLQGEVGSGKTLVAAIALLVAVANGFQSVLMAPTEILAEQHFKTLARLYESFAAATASTGPGAPPRIPRLALLTGSLKRREKEEILASIGNGATDLLVGTHAIIQEGVEFSRLGLCVVDEQHRFGVLQRSALRQKGFNPDLLVMTATPIPRTLALTLYGDLDISVIDELPPGRQETKTRWLAADERQRAYDFIRKQVRQGQQAFIICPLVDESDRIEAKAATVEFERLSNIVFPDLRLGLLHGRMRPAEKESAMQRFGAGELDVLVSTTVVEVGIDVPNASVMLVEGADRFGLSQLHQLRGRVGRGAHQSFCILLADNPSAEGRERLAIIEKNQDGFALAEEDMRLRGPGEFLGTRQSGLPDMKIAKLSDVRLIELARREALALFGDDPDLTKPENRLLLQRVAATWQRAGELS